MRELIRGANLTVRFFLGEVASRSATAGGARS
jgi:hypothetical protein